MKSTAATLAESFDFTRQLSLHYFKLLEGKDIYKEFEVENGVKLNSAYWILGHLVVTENYLLLKSTGADIVRFGWAKPFGLGGHLPAVGERVSVEEIMTTMREVHQKSMDFVSSLTDEQLKMPNSGAMKFGDGSVYSIINHAIRHEGTHAGHLSWNCKMHGIKTI